MLDFSAPKTQILYMTIQCFCQVWFKSVLWFQKKRWKCEISINVKLFCHPDFLSIFLQNQLFSLMYHYYHVGFPISAKNTNLVYDHPMNISAKLDSNLVSEKKMKRSNLQKNQRKLFTPWYSWNTAKVGIKHQSSHNCTPLIYWNESGAKSTI